MFGQPCPCLDETISNWVSRDPRQQCNFHVSQATARDAEQLKQERDELVIWLAAAEQEHLLTKLTAGKLDVAAASAVADHLSPPPTDPHQASGLGAADGGVGALGEKVSSSQEPSALLLNLKEGRAAAEERAEAAAAERDGAAGRVAILETKNAALVSRLTASQGLHAGLESRFQVRH